MTEYDQQADTPEGYAEEYSDQGAPDEYVETGWEFEDGEFVPDDQIREHVYQQDEQAYQQAVAEWTGYVQEIEQVLERSLTKEEQEVVFEAYDSEDPEYLDEVAAWLDARNLDDEEFRREYLHQRVQNK